VLVDPSSVTYCDRVQFRVLGPLEVATDDGRPVDLGSPKLRALLTLLLADAGRAVALDRINDTLWAGEPPASATGTLQSYISQLRRLLEPDRPPRAASRVLLTRPPGYLVVAGPENLDVLDFEGRVTEGERLLERGCPVEADATLLAALALWRGDPYAELGDAVQADRARLEELRLVALEHHVEALLAAGRPTAAVPELERLVAVHPLREGLWHALMLALYRSGRPTRCGRSRPAATGSATNSVSTPGRACASWSARSSPRTRGLTVRRPPSGPRLRLRAPLVGPSVSRRGRAVAVRRRLPMSGTRSVSGQPVPGRATARWRVPA